MNLVTQAELGCTCTREMTLIARANGETKSAHSIHPSLDNVLMIDFVYPKL